MNTNILPEKTGRHVCTKCLREVARDEFFANDHVCDRCALAANDFPLASTDDFANGTKHLTDH